MATNTGDPIVIAIPGAFVDALLADLRTARDPAARRLAELIDHTDVRRAGSGVARARQITFPSLP